MADPNSQSKFRYASDLAQTPLPEVLATISRYKVPGVVDCHRRSETKSIFVESGSIIFATSSDVADSLGDRLLAQGKITRDQYDTSVRVLQQGNKRQGTILVEMKAIEPKDLFIAVREQVQAIVWSIFEWTEGAVLFEPGRERTQEFIKLNIPLRQAILQGVNGVGDAKLLVSRMGNKTTILQRNDEVDAKDLGLSPEEEALLAAVDGKKSLYELTAIPVLPAAQNAKLLYAFFVLRLISVKPQRQLKVHLKMNSKMEP
jgi:hypothetical protein